MVSVIMPVYNAEGFLSDTIDSVLKQTFQNFELICVNDGSTDNSGAICEHYASSDPRVVVIHSENGGISAARNKGMAAARGEWISFIDHDDAYLPNLLEENVSLIKEHRADLVKFGYESVRIQGGKSGKEFQSYAKGISILCREDIPLQYKNLRGNEGDFVLVWNTLFSTAFLRDNNLHFNEALKYGDEDLYFNNQMLPHINRMVLNLSNSYYIHYLRSASTAGRFYEQNLYQTTILARQERQLFDDLSLDSIHPGYWPHRLYRYVWLYVFYILNKKGCPLSVRQRIRFLSRVRNESPFCDTLTKADIALLKKESFKKGGILQLFYNKHFLCLVMLQKLLPMYNFFKTMIKRGM